jgi:ribosomal protein S18 acetylase RimI-like enzyme
VAVTGIAYERGGVELLAAVGPLWEQLNEHHRRGAGVFAAEYAARSYQERRIGLLAKARTAALIVDLARDPATGVYVGYCISTVSDSVGEVDSIFVATAHRGRGIGGRLLERALDWLAAAGARSIKIQVAAGNEEAFAFYRRYGFYPRYTMLKRPSSL